MLWPCSTTGAGPRSKSAETSISPEGCQPAPWPAGTGRLGRRSGTAFPGRSEPSLPSTKTARSWCSLAGTSSAEGCPTSPSGTVRDGSPSATASAARSLRWNCSTTEPAWRSTPAAASTARAGCRAPHGSHAGAGARGRPWAWACRAAGSRTSRCTTTAVDRRSSPAATSTIPAGCRPQGSRSGTARVGRRWGRTLWLPSSLS